jgi:hypothetical protein
MICFELPEGATHDEALKISDYLDDKIAAISVIMP